MELTLTEAYKQIAEIKQKMMRGMIILSEGEQMMDAVSRRMGCTADMIKVKRRSWRILLELTRGFY